MAFTRPANVYVDPAAGAGNDFGGTSFTDGAFANATTNLNKTGAFPAATNIAGDLLYLTDNGSGEVTTGFYSIVTRTDDDNVVLDADIRSGANDPTDVVCTQHDGTTGTPWASLQHALNFTTQGSLGDALNLSDAAAAVENTLVLTTYGTPAGNKPLVIVGWDQGGDGIGEIDLNAGGSLFNVASHTGIQLRNLWVHNAGTALICETHDNCIFTDCEFSDTTGGGIVTREASIIQFNHFHDIGGTAVAADGSTRFQCVQNNYFTNDGSETMVTCISASRGDISGNIISVDSTTDGIVLTSMAVVTGNSLLSSGTGEGIRLGNASVDMVITNNLMEGFTTGFDLAATRELGVFLNNGAWNNTTNYTRSCLLVFDENDNEDLAASPFAKSGADTFANRFVYFAPTNISNIRGGAYPSGSGRDKGAVQSVAVSMVNARRNSMIGR